MAEAITKLERSLDRDEVGIFTDEMKGNLQSVINEQIKMLDSMRDSHMVKRRWVAEDVIPSRLNYLKDDLLEIAQDVHDFTGGISLSDFNILGENIKQIWSKIQDFMLVILGTEGGETSRLGYEEEEEEVVVGLEEDVQLLLHRVILSEDPDLLALCIKGMLGIGKTCLARQVYNHKAVVGRFERRAWVCVSSGMTNKEILVELVLQMVEATQKLERDYLLKEMDNTSIRQMLHQHLQGKSYFIVVDNMLEDIRLDYIVEALPDEGYGSRVLFTSRQRIAVSRLMYIHEMKCLNSDKSWQLFLKTIFRDNKLVSEKHKLTKQLERKGREMLSKCWGLPVAIIDVAKQKAKQRLSGVQWEQLFDSIDLSATLSLLESMYHDLSEKQKACFLHMPFFKENAIMREEKLKQIWGIRGLNAEVSTFNLVSISILESVNEFPFELEVKRCRLNPLLHMLSIKKAEEEIGFEILRCDGNDRPSQSPRHHRVVHCGRDKFNHSTDQNKHLVSLIFHGGGRYLDDASPSYWESFELLNILDLEDFGVKTLSETIGTSLMELRYLGLRNNYIQEIPHSLGGLKKLEVLDIAQNFMVEVPDIIWEMDSLRNLYMSDVICWKPLKIDALRNLETQTYISIYDWTYEVEGLETMGSLQKLGFEEVDENSDVSKLFASLAKLERLYRLTLKGFRFRSMPCLDKLGVLGGLQELRLDGLIAKLPSADNFPQEIKYLILVNTCLDEDPMPVLEKLPNLRRLKLRNAYSGREMVIKEKGFHSLMALCINELWNLRNVQVGKDAMPWLFQLQIKNCPYLESLPLPEDIGSMKRLRMLKMVTTKHIATKIKNSSLISKIVEVDISP